MPVRLWLHEGRSDPGYEAWCLDLVGFATYAPTRDAVLERVPAKLDEHLLWLDVHGVPAPRPDPGFVVVEEVAGDEALFAADREPASPDEIATTLAILDGTRADLVRLVDEVPDDVLDWDPPYDAFAEWATWRTVRQVLVHVANTEPHLYARRVGMRPATAPFTDADDWRLALARSRTQTTLFLRALQAAPDRARVTEGDGSWSVRKALRRMVRHELLHARSIRRILAAYDAAAS